MTYKGYEIKKSDDGSYSVWIDHIEDMSDLPTEDDAKAFIDGKQDKSAEDKLSSLVGTTGKVKHLSTHQVDKYVMYDPTDFIDTDNVYQVSFKSKSDRRSMSSKIKSNGFKVVDTTDADVGRYPYWVFVTPTKSTNESVITEDDSSIDYEVLSEYDDIHSRDDLIRRVISLVTSAQESDPNSDRPYFNIWAATSDNSDITTQYSYDLVYQEIDSITDDVIYPIVSDYMSLGDSNFDDEFDKALDSNESLKSELKYIDYQCREYGDALVDIWDSEAREAQKELDQLDRDLHHM